MKFFQNILKIIFVTCCFGTLIFAAESSAPIELSDNEICPPEVIAPFDQQMFDLLKTAALKGNPKYEYALATRYLSGNNPQAKKNLEEAEKWALKARSQDYLPAYELLKSIYSKTNNWEKLLAAVLDARNRGLIIEDYIIALAYHKIGDAKAQNNESAQAEENYKKAREYYLKAIKSNSADFADAAKHNYAMMLMEGEGGEKDENKALAYLNELANEGNVTALYNLGRFLLLGIGTAPDVKKAFDTFSKVLKKAKFNVKSIEVYYSALNLMGGIIEQGLLDGKPNPVKANHYFKQDPDNIDGLINSYRLVLQKKIAGNEADAIKALSGYAMTGNRWANFILGLYEITRGNATKAVNYFEKSADKNLAIAELQTGLAYFFGFGVEKDLEKANAYFNKILNAPYNTRAYLLAQGYLYLFGLGVKKDIKRGLELIDKSDKALVDDVSFSTEELFPAINRIREKFRKKSAKQLLADDQLKKKSKSRESKQPGASSSSVQDAAVAEQPETTEPTVQEPDITTVEPVADLLAITPELWNDHFFVKDSSYVSEINAQEKTITIIDPKRNEKLIVQVADQPATPLTQIESLQMAPRIALRQGLGKKAKPLSQGVIYDHSFAQMLDYVIQYAGEYVPFFKFGGGQPEDSLVAYITRINLKTGEKREGTAEYTFRKKGDGFEVYHRLLRTRKNTAVVYLTYPTFHACFAVA